LAFSSAEQRRFLNTAAPLASAEGWSGLAVLSTCNRTELYAASDDPRRKIGSVPPQLPRLLAAGRDLPYGSVESHLYGRVGREAVRHLSRVAAGLDSMVLGESEVLGQVSEAHQLAKGEGTLGLVLDAAFRTAVRAGRRARTETGINRHPTSVSAEAVRLAAESVADLGSARVLVVGTGRAGRLAGEALLAHGARRLSVVSRTARHAEELARDWKAAALPWHALEAAIREADVVVSSTGAPHAVITRELVEAALAGRGGSRPLLLVDIAVPRDVEEAVRRLPAVRVADLDDLQRRVDGNLAVRRSEVPAVEAIVDQEVRRFEEWHHGIALKPILAGLHAQGEAIRRRELDRLLRRLGPVSADLKRELDALTRSLVNKLLHAPTARLKGETDPEVSQAYARAARELFGLDVGRGDGEAGAGAAA
jgi:glutamyl-tRNA reductase